MTTNRFLWEPALQKLSSSGLPQKKPFNVAKANAFRIEAKIQFFNACVSTYGEDFNLTDQGVQDLWSSTKRRNIAKAKQILIKLSKPIENLADIDPLINIIEQPAIPVFDPQVVAPLNNLNNKLIQIKQNLKEDQAMPTSIRAIIIS